MIFKSFTMLFALLQYEYMVPVLSSSSINYNPHHHRLRNFGLKAVIFKEKKCGKLVKYIKDKYTICYEKSISMIGEGIIEYENLPYEEKTILDFIFSLVF